MARFRKELNWITLPAIGLTLAIVLVFLGCERKDPEEVEFKKQFNREAVLLAICASEPPIRIYRFRNELWFKEHKVWRRIEGQPENVCDVFQPRK